MKKLTYQSVVVNNPFFIALVAIQAHIFLLVGFLSAIMEWRGIFPIWFTILVAVSALFVMLAGSQWINIQMIQAFRRSKQDPFWQKKTRTPQPESIQS